MRSPAEKAMKREEILKSCFECLVKKGLENVSLRDLSNDTGLNSSSLYYWFHDKDDIVLNATEYGINAVLTELFEYTFKNIDDTEKMCNGFTRVVKRRSSELKFIIQIATSPQYGKKIVEMSEDFEEYYAKFAEVLANMEGVPLDFARNLIDLFVSAVIDCVVWDNWPLLSKEMNFLLGILAEKKGK